MPEKRHKNPFSSSFSNFSISTKNQSLSNSKHETNAIKSDHTNSPASTSTFLDQKKALRGTTDSKRALKSQSSQLSQSTNKNGGFNTFSFQSEKRRNSKNSNDVYSVNESYPLPNGNTIAKIKKKIKGRKSPSSKHDVIDAYPTSESENEKHSSTRRNAVVPKRKFIKETMKRARNTFSKKFKNINPFHAQNHNQNFVSTSTEQGKTIFDYPSSTEGEGNQEKRENESVADFDTELSVVELFEMPNLSNEEEQLFQLIKTGEDMDVKNMLSQMNVNRLNTTMNFEGETVFHSAVRRQNVSIVETLLSEVPNVENLLYDILLLSISLSNKDIAHIILEAIKSNQNLQLERGKLCDLPRWKHSGFDAHMTPIMMAAIIGNYDLIAIFAAEGEQLDTQLTYSSRTGRITNRSAEECQGRDICHEDILDDYQRLHEYQAQTSPEMICFLTNTIQGYDPLVRTFHYINELKFVKSREVEFRENYQELIDRLKDFSLQLLSMCETSKELDLFFSKSDGHGKHDRYPRIVMAVEMGLKEFVSHPHTQMVLYNEWAGQDWSEWRYFSTRSKFRHVVSRIFCIPAILFSIFLDQGGKQGKVLSCPLHRCLYAGISHSVFLILAITEHLLETSQPNERMPANFFIEIALALIVAGKFRALIRQFCFAPSDFVRILWNWYEIIYCCLFCVSFTCWFLLHFPADRHYRLRSRTPLERQYWKASDLLMIADVFLALGTIMACGQLLRYAQLHNKIGPIQIALGEMLKSFANFALFFIVVLSSFSLGITAIYAPYKGMQNSVTGEVQDNTFTSHSSTLIEMYWDLFGGADPSSAELITISVTDPSDPRRTEQYEHYITEITGKILYSVYSFFGPTILFSSILIGFISRTFAHIMEENDVNWRFHRAQIWMYFARASVMPPPFNLVPTLWDITSFFRTMRDVKGHPKKYFITCNCASCFHLDAKLSPQEKAKEEEIYFNLIKVLIQRYFRYKKTLYAEKAVSSKALAVLNKELDELKTIAKQIGHQCIKTKDFVVESGMNMLPTSMFISENEKATYHSDDQNENSGAFITAEKDIIPNDTKSKLSFSSMHEIKSNPEKYENISYLNRSSNTQRSISSIMKVKSGIDTSNDYKLNFEHEKSSRSITAPSINLSKSNFSAKNENSVNRDIYARASNIKLSIPSTMKTKSEIDTITSKEFKPNFEQENSTPNITAASINLSKVSFSAKNENNSNRDKYASSSNAKLSIPSTVKAKSEFDTNTSNEFELNSEHRKSPPSIAAPSINLPKLSFPAKSENNSSREKCARTSNDKPNKLSIPSTMKAESEFSTNISKELKMNSEHRRSPPSVTAPSISSKSNFSTIDANNSNREKFARVSNDKPGKLSIPSTMKAKSEFVTNTSNEFEMNSEHRRSPPSVAAPFINLPKLSFPAKSKNNSSREKYARTSNDKLSIPSTIKAKSGFGANTSHPAPSSLTKLKTNTENIEKRRSSLEQEFAETNGARHEIKQIEEQQTCVKPGAGKSTPKPQLPALPPPPLSTSNSEGDVKSSRAE